MKMQTVQSNLEKINQYESSKLVAMNGKIYTQNSFQGRVYHFIHTVGEYVGGQSNQEAMCEAITSTLQYVKADLWFKKLCEPQATKTEENTNALDMDSEKIE